jgi:hypothetical protein
MTNSNKCNINFQSKFAYINNEAIHIDNINDNNKCNLKCKLGHELIPVRGKKNVHHFRHKHSEDTGGNPMTEWHSEWQSNFPITEIDFLKINDTQNKDRRADVVLENSNLVLEFQHSKIEELEVNNRKHDYSLHNKQIIWIIDGNDFINKTHLKYCNRIYLEFVSDFWKYKSFLEYDYIFIDINEEIYKIYPKKIKSNMIDVNLPFSKKEFIDYLNNNNDIIFQIDIPKQSKLYVKQANAGSGKTFGIFQMLESDEFKHYKYFIMVSKQHSAKSVMFNEFKQQTQNGNLKYITNITEKEINKKYTISYTNEKTNSSCSIVIATIDSLMWNLGNKYHKELDLFSGLVNSIIDGYIEKNNINSINLCGLNLKLNKEVCLICDETQDLTVDYAKAIIQIMRNKYIDSYIVGDKLQSIMIENNAFTYLINNNFSYINKQNFEPINVCRRFYNKELINFVNTIVPFEKYGLMQIKPWKEDIDSNDDESLVIFEGHKILADDPDKEKINKNVENIMKYYDDEVLQNNYKPNDFLIVTPFTTKNPLVNALEIAINMYWNEKNNNNDFERYAIFHKSEEGSSINLSESDNATRIVSIHTSKGDGRNVVVVIGLSEKGLIRFSGETNNLVYDSLIHVAITRMKKKLYIRVENNGDDFYQKIEKYLQDNNKTSNIKPNLLIFKKIKYNYIIDTLKINNIFEILKNTIIDKTTLNIQTFEDNDKQIIDMGHHNIRYASMLIYLFIKIIYKENKFKDSDIKKQIQAIFYIIIKSNIYISSTWQDYNDNLRYNNDPERTNNKLCILKISNNGKDYIKYYDIIYNSMKNIQKKLEDIIKGSINELCPYESIILYYMTQTIDKGIYTDISITDIYNITDIYYNTFSKNFDGHDNCSCKKHFLHKKTMEKNSNIKSMKKYLSTHYEQINQIGNSYDCFLKEYPKINWLVNHNISFGNNSNFELYKCFNLIGYDDNNVFIFYIKPQFNTLNYNNILIDSIFDTFLIKSVICTKTESVDANSKDKYDKKSEDFNKFNNKKIKTIIFSLDNTKYYSIEWKDKLESEDLINNNQNMLINFIKDKLENKYKIECKYIFNYYKYWKEIYLNENLTANKIIKNIIGEYEKNKYIDKMPHFILKFFERIEYEIENEDTKKAKNKILKKYDDKDTFIDKLNKMISCSINEYFGIEDTIDDEIESD